MSGVPNIANPAPGHLEQAERALDAEDFRDAPLPGTVFRCAECEREVRTDNEVVTCAHGDEPTCDPCCEREHG